MAESIKVTTVTLRDYGLTICQFLCPLAIFLDKYFYEVSAELKLKASSIIVFIHTGFVFIGYGLWAVRGNYSPSVHEAFLQYSWWAVGYIVVMLLVSLFLWIRYKSVQYS